MSRQEYEERVELSCRIAEGGVTGFIILLNILASTFLAASCLLTGIVWLVLGLFGHWNWEILAFSSSSGTAVRICDWIVYGPLLREA